MNATDLQKLTDWLIDGARSAPSPPRMMAEACERLVRAGLPLWRVGVFVRTLHPDIFGRSFVWRHGAEVVMGSANFDVLDSDEFRSSPLSVLYSTGKEVRRRLSDSAAIDNSPFLAEMREEGVSDYLAFPLRFTDGSIHSASWTTKRPGGFRARCGSTPCKRLQKIIRQLQHHYIWFRVKFLYRYFFGNSRAVSYDYTFFLCKKRYYRRSNGCTPYHQDYR